MPKRLLIESGVLCKQLSFSICSASASNSYQIVNAAQMRRGSVGPSKYVSSGSKERQLLQPWM